MPTTPRWGLPYPASSDPPDGPAQIGALATALDSVAKHDHGLLSARPVSTPGSPGKAGRFYMADDEGVLYVDLGTAWLPISPRTVACKVVRSTPLPVASATTTVMSFDTQRFDTHGIWPGAGGNQDFTIPAGLGGVYLMAAQWRWDAAGIGRRLMFVRRTNVPVDVVMRQEDDGTNVAFQAVPAAGVALLNAGDTIRVHFEQHSGANLSLTVDASGSPTPLVDSPSFSLVRLGAL